MAARRSAAQRAASRRNLEVARKKTAGRKVRGGGYKTSEKLSYNTGSSAGRGPIRMHMS